jgi:hypothetical protein
MPPKRKTLPSEGSPKAKKPSKSNDRTTQLLGFPGQPPAPYNRHTKINRFRAKSS